MEQADGVGAAADAGHQRVGQPALGLQHLGAHLVADHRLEVAHHGRVGVRPRGGADQIIGVAHVGDPVAQRLVHGVLERLRAGRDGVDLGAQQLHAEHVGLLPLHVHRAHVDLARQPEARAHGGRRHAVLAGAGLGDDAGLAHAPGEQDLAQAVVDLVAAGVVQLVALEVDLGAAPAAAGRRLITKMLRQPLREVERARPAAVVGVEVVDLRLERRVAPGLVVGPLQVQDQRHQRLGDEAPAEQPEEALLVGAAAIRVELLLLGLAASSLPWPESRWELAPRLPLP